MLIKLVAYMIDVHSKDRTGTAFWPEMITETMLVRMLRLYENFFGIDMQGVGERGVLIKLTIFLHKLALCFKGRSYFFF